MSMEQLRESWNEQLEIEGDEREALERWLEVNDAHYLDLCERHGIVPDLVPIGKGTDPGGEEVSVWTFA